MSRWSIPRNTKTPITTKPNLNLKLIWLATWTTFSNPVIVHKYSHLTFISIKYYMPLFIIQHTAIYACCEILKSPKEDTSWKNIEKQFNQVVSKSKVTLDQTTNQTRGKKTQIKGIFDHISITNNLYLFHLITHSIRAW